MPNDDLISRSDLQKAFERECIGECGCCKHVKHNPEGCALIDNSPAVDAEPVKYGKWRKTCFLNGKIDLWPPTYECSECNSILFGSPRTNYCPNCGAKMDEEE